MLFCENNDFLWSCEADVLAELLSALLLSQENVVTASCSVAKMMYLLLLQVAKIDYLLLHQVQNMLDLLLFQVQKYGLPAFCKIRAIWCKVNCELGISSIL